MRPFLLAGDCKRRRVPQTSASGLDLSDPQFWNLPIEKDRTGFFGSKMVTSWEDKPILEEKMMYGPSNILTWLEENVEGMRRSRMKTLASIVSGAMRMQSSGVLALGRAMEGPALAKLRIKRVDRFLGNESMEIDAVGEAIFHRFRTRESEVVVLADWTDRHRFQQLVLALPRDGRAMPLLQYHGGERGRFGCANRA